MVLDSMGWGVPSVLAIGVPDFHHIVVPPTGQKSPIGGPLQSTHIHLVRSHRGHMKLSHPGVVVVDEPLLVPAAQEACLRTPGQAVDSRLMRLHSTNQLGIADVP